MKKYVIFACIFLCLSLPLFSVDFGLGIIQTPAISGMNDEIDFSYAAKVNPWLSGFPSEKLNFYLSAFFTMNYENKEWEPIFDVGRFELTYRPVPQFSLQLGRMQFQDPLKFTASGLFDGLSGTFGWGNNRLSLGAYYTGLLYHKTARVYMTAPDLDTDYFAGRRVLASLKWENPSLFNSPHNLALNLLAQFDLNGEDEKVNSQYLTLRFLLSPVQSLNLVFGAALGLAEPSGSDFELGLAGHLGLEWFLPTPVSDLFTLKFDWGSGDVNDTIRAFRPVSSIMVSHILDAGIPGLMAISGAYMIQFPQHLSFDAEVKALLRSDLQTLGDTYFSDNINGDSRFLGTELWASANWAPLADLSLGLGGGAFIPGNALVSDTPVRWKASFTLSLSF